MARHPDEIDGWDTLEIERVDVARILSLRTRVLRPHMWPEELARWQGDEAAGTSHWAALPGPGAEPIGCATFMVASPPWDAQRRGLRLRGMAVVPERRDQGVGALLLDVAMNRLAPMASPTRLLWCHARERARPFYERHGFVVRGERFEVEGIGPHYVMARELPRVIA